MRADLTLLPDADLMSSLKALVSDERSHVVSVLRHLAEMERRRLAHKEGYPSLFEYCRRELRYSEGEAGRRIQAMRASVKFPILYRAIDRGLLSLTAVSMLSPHLSWDNHARLIRASLGRSTREVEKLIAAANPTVLPAERVRFIATASSPSGPPVTGTTGAPPEELPLEAIPPAPSEHEEAVPLGAPRVQFSFTATEALLSAVERAKELMRHRHPFGGLEEVFTAAVDALLERIDPNRRAGRARSSRVSSGHRRMRQIPQAVKAQVWRRDGGRCVFVSERGRRCGATGDLEYDHIRPWARGGASDVAENIRLLCRGHNALEARREFGDAVIDRGIARRGRPPASPAGGGPAKRDTPGNAPGVS